MKILDKFLEIRAGLFAGSGFGFLEIRLLLVLFFLIPLIFSVYGFENFTTIKFSLLLLVVSCLLWTFARRGRFLYYSDKNFWIFLFLFLIGSVVSVFFAFEPLTAIYGFYRRFTNSLVFFSCWSVVLVILLSKNVDFKIFETIIKLSAFSAVCVALFGVLQSLGVAYYRPEEIGFSRVSSLLGNANFSAMYVAVNIPFLLIYFFRYEGYKKWLSFFALCISVLGTVIFASRGAVFALVSGLVLSSCLAAFYWRKNLKFVLSAGLVVMVVSGISFLFFDSVRVGSLTNSDSNITSRLAVWDFAVTRIRENFWVGVGLGNYANDYLLTRPNYLGVKDMDFDDPHNLFLYVLLEGGILTFVGFLGLIVLAISRVVREYRNTQDPLMLASLAALVAWLVSASFNPVEPANWVFLAFLLALCLKFSAKEYSEVKLFFLARGFMYLSAINLFFLGVGFAVSEPLLDFANGNKLFQNYEKSYEYSKWAVRVNPIREQGYIFQLGAAMKMGYSPEKIKPVLDRYAILRPNELVTLGNLGVMNHYFYQKTGERRYLNEAIKFLELAQSKNVQARKPGQLLAYIYYEDGEVGKAKNQAMRNIVIAQSPEKNFDDYALLSRLYLDENKFEATLYYLEQVYKLDTRSMGYKQIIQYLKKQKDLSGVVIPITFSTGLFY